MKTFALIASTALFLAAFSAVAQKPANHTAPATFRVNFDTSKGPVVIEVTRALAPNGADHFYSLVKAKYYDGARFFRVVPASWRSSASPPVPLLLRLGMRRFRTTL